LGKESVKGFNRLAEPAAGIIILYFFKVVFDFSSRNNSLIINNDTQENDMQAK
jgi:hypothetical protein